MNPIFDELTGGLPDPTQLGRAAIRLFLAMLLGAVIGIQRERAGKAAGLRTHMLVAMGSALFVLSCGAAGMTLSDLSRVIQGVATGIGFIGAGAILKWHEEHQVKGITTAAGIWMTAAAGSAIGLGQAGLAMLGVLAAWVVLALFARFDSPHKGGPSDT